MKRGTRGRPFAQGEDSRRHTFTREECQRGYRAAEESLSRRFPGCDVHFLMCALMGSRPWFTLTVYAGWNGEEDAASVTARFARD